MASGDKGRTASFSDYLSTGRPAIAAALRRVCAERGGALQARISGGAEVMERILAFALQGKMIRGCLVFLGRDIALGAGRGEGEVAGRDDFVASDDLAILAAAMELFQAGLLVHDDIMDRDALRRGMPTMHTRYANELAAAGAPDSAHAGEGLGICAGDACCFEGFAAASRALGAHPRQPRILALCAELLSEVAVAQMADVRWGASASEVSEAEILAMYRCKTARYSFSLPLAVGALAAEKASGGLSLEEPLIGLGERLGVLFQLRDDELGLFADEASTGKEPGSDLREGKKTLFRARLLAAAPREELRRLKSLFAGGSAARSEDIAYLRRLAEELGVARSIEETARLAEAEALAIVRSLPESGDTKAVLESLVEYVTRRKK